MNFFKHKAIWLVGIFFAVILGVTVLFFFIGEATPASQIAWGVNFSAQHAEKLGLDPRETYLALLDDLEVKRVKIAADWDILEPEDAAFDFEELDWHIAEAEKRGVSVLFVAGMKTPRWPECKIPRWLQESAKERRQEETRELLSAIVQRYKNSAAIWGWQVENEALFPFGECPPPDKDFLREEAALVKQLDSSRPVVVSDTGEWSLWFEAARSGDIVGTTLYRKVWFKNLGLYVSYPLPTVFYARKARLVKKLFGKRVINVELQAEPWGPVLLYDLPREEQEKTMNLARFRNVIDFAKRTGFDEFYLWGAEWWYWLKTQGDDSIWEEARDLFER
ncbi:MAG: beta-galactosidase [Patescibacteria group bacterium]